MFNGRTESIVIAAPSAKLWKLLCGVMGKSEMTTDPVFATGPDRPKNLKHLVGLVETWLKTYPNINEPLALIEAAGIPCAKVNTTIDLLENEQLKAREMITDLETSDGISTRSIKARGNSLKFSGVKAVLKKPPVLGQHQDEIFRLGRMS